MKSTAIKGVINSDILINPDLSKFKASSPKGMEEMIKIGYDATMEVMDEIKEMLKISVKSEKVKSKNGKANPDGDDEDQEDGEDEESQKNDLSEESEIKAEISRAVWDAIEDERKTMPAMLSAERHSAYSQGYSEAYSEAYSAAHYEARNEFIVEMNDRVNDVKEGLKTQEATAKSGAADAMNGKQFKGIDSPVLVRMDDAKKIANDQISSIYKDFSDVLDYVVPQVTTTSPAESAAGEDD